MQFNLVNNKEMLDFLYIRVHDEVVCLVVSSLRHVCRYSCRSQGLSTMAIWNQVGKSVVWPLLFFKRSFSCSAFLLPSQNPFIFFLFPLLSQCDGCLKVPEWVLMVGLREC